MAAPRALLLDINGVLLDEDGPIAGAAETLAELRRRGLPLRFVTNTVSRPHEALAEELRQHGFTLEPHELFTAGLAARSYLDRHQLTPLALVHPALDPLFPPDPSRPADCVLLGDARDRLSYANLNAAFELLMRGKPLIAIGRNRRFRSQGRWLLDGGAFVRALEYGAGCEAVVMGKPEPAFFQEVLASLGMEPAEVLMVGDDVEADVAAARALGLQAALVQTGKFSAADRQRLPAGACLWADLRELLPLLEG